MKWAYSIRRKISAALLLTAIFTLLFVKNLVDSKNVAQLGNSFSSVYEDRLVVESYIYRMSEHLFRKKFMLDTCSSGASAARIQPVVTEYNTRIAALINDYEKTRLTEAEAGYFEAFKKNVARLRDHEASYFRNAEVDAAKIRGMINAEFNQASTNLDRLSSIQLAEGKILNERSKKIVAGSSILTKLEIGILIAIGLMVLVLVFESTTRFFPGRGKESLN